MKNRSRKLLAGLAVASATLLGSADAAQAQTSGIDLSGFLNLDWTQWLPDGSIETVELCALDAQTGEGRYTRSFSSINARRYVRLGTYSYISEVEDCTNAIDDNCDGTVNEGCEPSDAICGNGQVEPGEECDDGNRFNYDACTNTCATRSYCGNGIVEDGEQCDDGNLNNNDDCTRTCQSRVNSSCGNGIVEEGEECDDGNYSNNDSCTTTCLKREYCGDGIVNGNEECDDGNRLNGDGCSEFCVTTYICGNGVVEGEEECDLGDDNGKLDNGEGNPICDSDCTEFKIYCGNGQVEPGEACDDGNDNNDDECSNNCERNNVAVCGNGQREGDEECDDGNTDAYDGCSATCEIEDVCGDKVITGDEQCDDGNTVMGDGCDENCQIELPKCGDGQLNQDIEECDDGNNVDNDGCSATCTLEPYCGDGIVNGDEICDDGNDIETDSCSSDCTPIRYCGNGVIDTDRGETCDDNNNEPNDGCDPSCQIELCGNGVVDQGEECDDGNYIDDDTCSNLCVLNPVCGDGSVNSDSEQCDDGNTDAGDGCDENCQIEAYCGDGVKNGDEECDGDDGLAGLEGNNGCLNDCTLAPYCGDGEVNAPGEKCDGGSDCRADCTPVPFCGDGLINRTEESCDEGDQNGLPGSDCSDTCLRVARCGNGYLEVGNNEMCDNGEENGMPGNACSATCEFVPPTADLPYKAKGGADCEACMAEQCLGEIGRCALTDGCLEAGQCQAETACADTVLGPLACICGDNISVNDCIAGGDDVGLDSFQGACASEIIAGLELEGEERTRGNVFSRISNPSTPMGLANQVYTCLARFCPAECEEVLDQDPVCGNGIVEDGEACDDGNDVAGDGCEANCTDSPVVGPKCGDGVVEEGEVCDDGNTADGDSCSADCTRANPFAVTADACNACVKDSCAAQADVCLGEAECSEVVACEVGAKCLSSTLGPLSCLCGTDIGVTQCQGVVDGAFTGPCAATIQKSLGTETNTGDTFSLFANQGYGAGRAHQLTICAGRFCYDECKELVFDY